MKVIDNFMPEDAWTEIRDMVMVPHNAFPWNFAPDTVQDYLLKVDPLDAYQFVHTPYTVMTNVDNPNIPKGTGEPVFNNASFKFFLPILNNPKLNCRVLISKT